MRYLFNNYSVDRDCFELHGPDGARIAIEPQAISLLILLIENNDRMLGKEEIYETIWHGKVVSESALSSRIKMIRQAVGDDGRKQNTIRTIHGKGFRFIATLNSEDTGLSSQTQSKTAKDKTKPSVAVLPFLNLSSDRSQEYISDGISADIIAQLAKYRWLNITARNTTFCYKGKSVDIRVLAKELNVAYVVEGSVQRTDSRIRINVNLIDGESGHQLWGEQYDRDLTDIFAVQDDIIRIVVAQLEPEIGFSEREKVVQSGTENVKAWDCFHLGVYEFFKFTDEDNLKAQALLRKSQRLDPSFGEAYAWWAYAVILGMVYWSTTPEENQIKKALAACDKALVLDRNNATFYALKARVLLANKQYDRAVVENEKAIKLNPSFAAAYCGLGDSLAYGGQYKESISYFEKAISLSPNDPQLWAFYSYGALALIFSGEYARAVEWSETASLIPNCQYWAIAHKIVALAYLDKIDALKEEKQRLVSMFPKFNLSFAKEKLFYLSDVSQVEMYLLGLHKAGIY